MFGMFKLSEGMTPGLAWLVWLGFLVGLFVANEITRRSKWMGFFAFFILPIILTFVWFGYMDPKNLGSIQWFTVAKTYSATAGCLGFWCLRFVKGVDKKTGKEWRLIDNKWALIFPPAILAINILEAVLRDFEVGNLYWGVLTHADVGGRFDMLLGGPWNYMNAIAGILNIITITGWVGITIRKKTKTDGSQDMLWPDMLWFWVVAYDIWNFDFTYNCLPGVSWYVGLALLIAPTICAYTTGKGAWLQHRAHTLALMCFTVQSFGTFFYTSKYAVASTNDPRFMFAVAFLALASNVGVFAYMLYKMKVTGRHPYKGELYTDNHEYLDIKSRAEDAGIPGLAQAA